MIKYLLWPGYVCHVVCIIHSGYKTIVSYEVMYFLAIFFYVIRVPLTFFTAMHFYLSLWTR